MLKTLAKLAALAPLAVVLFIGNAYGSLTFARLLFAGNYPRPYIEMIGAAIVGALVGGVLVAYPLAKLFPSRYWLAAVVVSLPLMALRVGDLQTFSGAQHTAIVVMSVVELLVVPLTAAAVAWLFVRFYPRLLTNAA
jgi:hypothetical protein